MANKTLAARDHSRLRLSEHEKTILRSLPAYLAGPLESEGVQAVIILAASELY